MTKDYFVGEGSRVSESELESGVKIWYFCNIYGCKIGAGTQVGSYTEIKAGAIVGKNCRMQAYVFIPEGTVIGDEVFIGPRVTFLNDKYPTVKKAREISWNLEACVIEDEVSIGGGAIILPGIRVGRVAAIGAGSVVTKDVSPYSVVLGNPAKVVGYVGEGKYKQYGGKNEGPI